MASRQDRLPFQRFGALSAQLSPAERAQREGAVRTAAIAAARGRPLPPAVLDFIVASSDWRQDQQALEARAAGIADHVVHDVRTPNWSGAHPQEVAAYLAALGRQFGDYRRGLARAMGEDSRDADGSASSARLDRISASDAALLSEMRHHAIRCGLHWAADRPEILRLGREAIELFARTRFTRESFDRLKDVGFDRRDILHLVKRAEESGQDANTLARTTEDTVRILGGGNPQREQEIRTALAAFHERPTDAGAWQRLDEVLRRYETEGTPEQQVQAAKQREAEEKIRQVNAEITAETAVASAVTTTHAAGEGRVDAGIDDLNGPAPPGAAQQPAPTPPPGSGPTTVQQPAPTPVATSTAATQPTRHVAGPR